MRRWRVGSGGLAEVLVNPPAKAGTERAANSVRTSQVDGRLSTKDEFIFFKEEIVLVSLYPKMRCC